MYTMVHVASLTLNFHAGCVLCGEEKDVMIDDYVDSWVCLILCMQEQKKTRGSTIDAINSMIGRVGYSIELGD